jgi:uncharacterized membrane protein
MILRSFALLSLLASGAIFGFFYAWVCSAMWGLDAADPRVAISAMQAINAQVRNMVFAPAFMGTPVILLLTAAIAFFAHARRAAGLFALAAAIYFLGGLVLTMTVHVPMNEDLASIQVPQDIEKAGAIWSAYSPGWQTWNVIRTVFSGLALTVCGLATLAIPHQATR